MTTPSLPPWPADPPRQGQILLRKVLDQDVAMAQELSTDPYVPLTGSLPPNASAQQAADWVTGQQQRHTQGSGFSFTIAEATTGEALGHCNLGLAQLQTGRAAAGYSVRPSQRGRGVAASALIALTTFGWTIPQLHRIELYIEPWNTASARTAEKAGYLREGLLRSHQEIGGSRRDMLLYASIRAC